MEGLLVMADISGYTKFVAGTEAEHSREILAELMDGIAKSFGGRLAIDQVEGDALACTTERTDVGVVDWLRETFRLFHGRLRDIRTATTCPCRACATVQDLGLKFIVHRGEFSRYEVAGRVQLHGNDVNVVHRLLKNTVPLREYLLATAAAQTSWPESLRAQLKAAPQTYDVGAVDAAYLDLRPVRDSVWNEPRPKVDPASAKIRGTVRYPGTPEQVFRYFTDASLRKLWLAGPAALSLPGARGSLVGAEYHCIHGENQKRCSASWPATRRESSLCRWIFRSSARSGGRIVSRPRGRPRRAWTPRSPGTLAVSPRRSPTSWRRGCSASTARSTTGA